MVLEVLRGLRREKAKSISAVVPFDPIDYLRRHKESDEKLASDFQRLQEKKSQINQFLSQTGVLKGLNDLQKDEDVKNSNKTAIVIDPCTIYDNRGEVTLVWGSKFEVEEDHVIHQKTGLFRDIWERDYRYITVTFMLDGSYMDIEGRDGTEAIFLDEPISHQEVQVGLAKAFLNPKVEKSRLTSDDRAHKESSAASGSEFDRLPRY